MGFEGAPKSDNHREKPVEQVDEAAAALEKLKSRSTQAGTPETPEERLPGELTTSEEEKLKETIRSIQGRQ